MISTSEALAHPQLGSIVLVSRCRRLIRSAFVFLQFVAAQRAGGLTVEDLAKINRAVMLGGTRDRSSWHATNVYGATENRSNK
jgi:hypothetical protein